MGVGLLKGKGKKENLKLAKQFGAFLWPILAVFIVLVAQIDNQPDALFPNHLPEVGNRRLHWRLGGNICLEEWKKAMIMEWFIIYTGCSGFES